MADADVPRKRARQACVACNARRVRCNVIEQRPCQNCIVAGVACETRESRRGKHPRPSKRVKTSPDSSDVTAIGNTSQQDDEVAVSHVLASLHKNRPSDAYLSSLGGQSAPVDVKSNPQDDQLREDEGAVFLGESSSLRYVQPEAEAGKQPQPSPQLGVRMRHSVPTAVKADALMPRWEAARRSARIELLQAEGAFSLPPQHILQQLLQTYFRDFHPCFAIVSEPEVWDQLHQGTLSPLLLQAMLFVGVIHCDESVLLELGLDNRHKAKYIYFNRVKDIYDADYERKKLTVIQALFLMSFWRAGALLEKDARHWLGAAITLAETKALHRSTGSSVTASAKLRKRIWWSMYTREGQCAAALGLPNRVRDDDCDVEPLDRSDFDGAFASSVPVELAERYISYAIGMADLAQLLGKIILGEYSPNRTLSPTQRSQMRNDLQQWKQRLPYEMRCDTDVGQANFYTNMLHLAYNNLLILLYRPGFIHNEDDVQDVDGNVALQAAARNSTVIEDMLAEGNLRHGQIHVITNLFNTLCIHTVHMRRAEGTARAVAEHRAKLCLLGLKELQRTWEVKNWLLKMFFQYLDHSTAARLRVERDDDSALPTALASTRASQEPLPPELDVRANTSNPNMPMEMTNAAGVLPVAIAPPVQPWTWTEEENDILFSQIENDFAFGEGGSFEFSPDDPTLMEAPYMSSVM